MYIIRFMDILKSQENYIKEIGKIFKNEFKIKSSYGYP